MTRRVPQQLPSEEALRLAVEARAAGRCEYCRAPQWVCGYRFHLDHVVPSSKFGEDDLENRSLACSPCNLAKSAKTKGTDPDRHRKVRLFNPRSDRWDHHFRWHADQVTIEGLTATGRATVHELDMNSDMRKQARRLWVKLELLP